MKEDIALDELDTNRVHEIVTEVFQRRGLSPPYSIEYRQREEDASKPQVYLEGEILHVVASTEPELRRLIGRFVVRHTWSRHDFLLITHTRLYFLTGMVLLTALPLFSYLLADLLPDLRVWIVITTLILITAFSIWISYQVSKRSIRLMGEFTIEMADIGCMTEYDTKDYVGNTFLTTLGAMIICIWAIIICIFLGNSFYGQEALFVLLALIVLIPAAIYFHCSPTLMYINSDLCSQTDEDDEGDEETEVHGFQDNKYLQTSFVDMIERMELRKSLSVAYESEFDEVRARYSKVRYPQCAGVYPHVRKKTLFIDVKDLSEAAAERYGAAALAKRSLRFFTELSFNRRELHLLNLGIGCFLLTVPLVGAYAVSKEFAIASLLLIGILYAGLWYIGWKPKEEARRNLPQLLQKSGVFRDYEVDFYSHLVFRSSSRSDLMLLFGFLISVAVLGGLILALT